MTTPTDSESVGSRVKKTLERIGATITLELDTGEIDFALDGIDGFARDRHGKFRASFFFELDPDPLEATAWAASQVGLPNAEVQFIDVVDGTALRLLVELPFDESWDIQLAANAARALNTAWIDRRSGGQDIVSTLGSAGIALPPLGSTPLTDVHAYGAWSWGSRYIPPFDLYMFKDEFIASQLIEHGPMFAMSHAGHGMNSYGLNVVTTSPSGAVAALVQHGFGGVYTNPVADLIDINTTYSRLHVLLQAVDEQPVETVRWLLLYSQFRGVCGLVDLDTVRRGESFEQTIVQFDGETELFEAIVDQLQLSTFDEPVKFSV